MNARLTTSTTSVWLASFFIAHGLTFVRATALAGENFKVVFHFEDPGGQARDLIQRFRDDVELHRLIGARRVAAGIMSTVQRDAVCEAAAVEGELAAIALPWAAAR